MATSDTVNDALAVRKDNSVAVNTDLTLAINQMRGEFGKILTTAPMVNRFVRVALTEVRQNPKLRECSTESVLGALMTCAQLGLEPGRTLGQAWLIPYVNHDTGEVVCQFIAGYKGLLKLAWQSEQVASIVNQTVHEGDEFDFAYGLDEYLRHRPVRTGRGQAYAWYCAVKTVNGGAVFEVLYRDDVERIRKRSKAKDSGPWKTDYDQMARKTAIRQVARLLPMSTAFNTAVAHDGSVRTDPTPEHIDNPAITDGDQPPV